MKHKPRNVGIMVLEDGSYVFQIGQAQFCFDSALMDLVEKINAGDTPANFVLVSDLMEKNLVKILEVDGQPFTKTDIRIILKDLENARSNVVKLPKVPRGSPKA